MAIATVEETYTVYGDMNQIFTNPHPEKILGGPAGTGKSRCNLEYQNYLAMEYPGSRHLMLRKTRRSLTESGMVTFENKVLHPAQGVHFSASKQRYVYPNGSILAVGGMDKASKVLSSEWDTIYVQEANELDESDWEMASMRIRYGVTPYQQMLGDVNPGDPNHWIKRREQEKRTLLLETYHEDNPVLFDRSGTITPEGQRYLERLDQLTGVRYLRFRKGLWVSADGLVYEESWNPKVNLVNSFIIPRSWRRWLSIDFGFTNPFVCQWFAMDDDGRLYRYREIYMTKRLVEDHAKDIAIASGWFHLLPKNHEKYKPKPAEWADPLPQEIICDHDIEDRKTLERHLGLYTTAAKKAVSDGIQATAARMRVAGDGKPRLMFLRDSLVEVDRDLAADKKPTCFEDEISGYVWKQGSTGPKEEPVKEWDHACDSTRYMCNHLTVNAGGVEIVRNWR
jgi:phage terminase large subunit